MVRVLRVVVLASDVGTQFGVLCHDLVSTLKSVKRDYYAS